MWIKAVAPLVDILKIPPGGAQDKRGVTAKHLNQAVCNNFKKTLTLQGACAIFDSNGELLQTDTLQEVYTNSDSLNKQDLSSENSHNKDTFKCGSCKAQFQALAAFIDHKRTQCDYLHMTEPKTEKGSNGHVPFPDIILSGDDKLSADVLPGLAGPGEFIELGDDDRSIQPENALSLILGHNQVLITNPMDLTNQIILAPKKTELILTTEGGESVVLDAKNVADNFVMANPTREDLPGNDIILSGELTNDDKNALLTVNPGLVPDDVRMNLLTLRYDDEVPAKTDKTDRCKTKLPCSYCGKLFEKPFNLQQHERVHTGERPFQCVICGRAFSQKVNVRKHMIRHKVWPQAKQTLKIKSVDEHKAKTTEGDVLDRTSYSCQYCSLSFSSYSLHKKHLVVHSDFKVYRCIQKGCDATFSDLDEFLSHSESHSSAEFQCHVCLKVFTSLEELGTHQYDHDLPNRVRKDFNIKLKCEVCHAQFKSAESLKNHLAVDTHNYECPHCKSVFSCERFLRRHLATHTDPSQSKFRCEQCKKTFRTQKYLTSHSFIHSSEKPFNCELCDKQFASKYRLKRHLAIHLSQYIECPFKAYIGCDKKFYRKDKLRNHVSTHCHVKVRSCQICSKSFASLAKLQQHMKREHAKSGGGGRKKQVLKCAGCSQTFRKQKQMSQHCCTVAGDKKFKSRVRCNGQKASRSEEEMEQEEQGEDDATANPELVSNIEIIMVPYIANN